MPAKDAEIRNPCHPAEGRLENDTMSFSALQWKAALLHAAQLAEGRAATYGDMPAHALRSLAKDLKRLAEREHDAHVQHQ